VSSDVTGRIAAAGYITSATTIGSAFQSVDNTTNDPWGSLANGYAVVAGAGISASGTFDINGGGNVYAPTNAASYFFNDGGHLVTSGPSPINFGALATSLDTESLQLAAYAPSASETGTVCSYSSASCAPAETGSIRSNTSLTVLYGSSSTLNVFDLTAAQFASTSNALDIEVPVGSTVIVNVAGTSVTLGQSVYFNGSEESVNNDDGGNILFNFAGASTVSIDGQVDGAVLAPFAVLTANCGQMGGTVVAAEIDDNSCQMENAEFNGILPTISLTPEPGTLVLMGTGMLSLAGMVRRRKRAGAGSVCQPEAGAELAGRWESGNAAPGHRSPRESRTRRL
jgi:choice-of-anchor A domain-containing protein